MTHTASHIIISMSVEGSGKDKTFTAPPGQTPEEIGQKVAKLIEEMRAKEDADAGDP
jgi:hypothetical protein